LRLSKVNKGLTLSFQNLKTVGINANKDLLKFITFITAIASEFGIF
jgi:hypothetical protein